MQAFECIKLKPDVISWFQPFLHAVDGKTILFAYYSKSDVVFETFAEGRARSVATSGIWQACHTHPQCVKDLFLFPSAVEALSFFNYKASFLTGNSEVAAASTGLLAGKQQVLFLKDRYEAAKIHLIYPADLTGRITDCKIALWLKGRDTAFYFNRDTVRVTLGHKIYLLSENQFSLFSFQRQTGLRFPCRTYKPRSRYNSYYDLLLDSI